MDNRPSVDAPAVPAPSADSLREKIRALTTILNGVRPRKAQVPQHGITHLTKTFVHLAQLLNHSTQNAIALTGASGYPNSQVILVAPMHPDFPVTDHRYSVVTLNAVPVLDSEWAQTTISYDNGRTDTLALAKTLLWVIQRLGAMSSGPEKWTFRDRANRWFLRACWDKYYARLVGTMELEWTTLPAEAMLKWQPNDNDRYILQKSEGKIRVSVNNQKHFVHFTREVVNGSLVVYFNADQASLWVHLIARLVKKCYADVKQKPAESNSSPIDLPVGFDTSAMALPLLSVLLSCAPVETILTNTSLATAVERRDSSDARRGGVGTGDNTDLPEHPEQIEEFFDEATLDTPNQGGVLVLKFLQALVMTHRALAYLSANASSFQNPNVTFVRFPTLPEDRRKYPHAQIEEIKKELGVGTHACTWAEDRIATYFAVNRHFLGGVHAEAAVMALSCLDSENLMNRGTKLPIGVSKKCCWTCWKLSQLLQSRDTRQTFDLPDSHGTIYGWDPPEIGIPTTVLKDLSESLIQEVRVAAALDAEERKSLASSLASGLSEMYEEENGGHAGDLDLDDM